MFGVEDSLVSTLGALTGVAVGTQNVQVVVLTGVVLLFAEATSMSAGSYLSSKSETEVWLKEHARDWEDLMKSSSTERGPVGTALAHASLSTGDRTAVLDAVEVQRRRWLGQMIRHERNLSSAGNKSPILASVVMGVSYILAGAIPLIAYFVFPIALAIPISIAVTFVTLFCFGIWKASVTGQSKWRSSVEMVVVAGIASGVAYLLGFLAKEWIRFIAV